jgi:hypothetical protein
MGDPQQSHAPKGRGAALDRANHDCLGRGFFGLDVRQNSGAVLHAAISSRLGGVRIFSRSRSLPDFLVSPGLPGQDHLDVYECHCPGRGFRKPLLRVDHGQDSPRRRPGQLAMAVSSRRDSIGDRRHCRALLSERWAQQCPMAEAGRARTPVELAGRGGSPKTKPG